MTIEEMLESRHTTHLTWYEPWSAAGPEGNDLLAHVTLSATVDDCINMSRAAARGNNHPTSGRDRDFLLDFILTHWAEVA